MHVSVGRTTTPRVVFLKCGQKLQKLPSLSFWTRRVGSTWVQTRGVQVVTCIKASLPCDGLRLRPPGGGCCVLKKSTMYHARLKPTACGKDIELKLAGLHSNLTEGAPSQLHESVQFDAHEAHPTYTGASRAKFGHRRKTPLWFCRTRAAARRVPQCSPYSTEESKYPHKTLHADGDDTRITHNRD